MYIPHSPVEQAVFFLSAVDFHEDPALEVRWRVGWSGGCKGLLLVPVAWSSSRHQISWDFNGDFNGDLMGF